MNPKYIIDLIKINVQVKKNCFGTSYVLEAIKSLREQNQKFSVLVRILLFNYSTREAIVFNRNASFYSLKSIPWKPPWHWHSKSQTKNKLTLISKLIPPRKAGSCRPRPATLFCIAWGRGGRTVSFIAPLLALPPSALLPSLFLFFPFLLLSFPSLSVSLDNLKKVPSFVFFRIAKIHLFKCHYAVKDTLSKWYLIIRNPHIQAENMNLFQSGVNDSNK